MSETAGRKCPYCDSTHIRKTGHAKVKQRFVCSDCDKKHRDNSLRMRRFPPKVIARALELFYRGRSLRQTGKIIEDEFGDVSAGISPQTVSNWVTWYAEAASNELGGKRATTGVNWVAYLIWLNHGPRWWVVMDRDTRYILGSQVAWGDQEANPQSVMRKALASAAHPCEILTCKQIEDGMNTRRRSELDESLVGGFRDALSDYAPQCAVVTLDSETVDSGEERFLERVKAMVPKYAWSRNGKLLDTYLTGWAVSYNFFADPLTDSEITPAQMAQIQVPFGSWEDIVRQADKWAIHRAAAEKSDLT